MQEEAPPLSDFDADLTFGFQLLPDQLERDTLTNVEDLKDILLFSSPLPPLRSGR